MPTLEEIQKQIEGFPDSKRWLGRKEVKELPSILADDEVVENMMQGMYENGSGVVFITNKRLLFVDKGIMKLRVEDFPYDKISSVQYKTGLLMGEITIYASGNKAEITHCAKDIVQGFADHVKRKMAAKNEPEKPAAAVAPSSGDDVISKLERLAKLKEQGILTDEEFLQQKTKILSE